MAGISRSTMTKKNAGDWVEGTERADRARAHVAAQLNKLILEGSITGSPEYVAKRVRSYSDAVRHGDESSQRAALMELAVAAAAGAAALDLGAGSRTVAYVG
jgi:hypothetical protein